MGKVHVAHWFCDCGFHNIIENPYEEGKELRCVVCNEKPYRWETRDIEAEDDLKKLGGSGRMSKDVALMKHQLPDTPEVRDIKTYSDLKAWVKKNGGVLESTKDVLREVINAKAQTAIEKLKEWQKRREAELKMSGKSKFEKFVERIPEHRRGEFFYKFKRLVNDGD